MGYTLTSPVNYIPVMTSGYGPRHVGGTYSFHRGQDYAMPRGTTLYCPRKSKSGTIYAYYQPGGFGNYVYIKCDDGIGIAMAHLDKVFIRSGQRVNFNSVIGLSGMTGKATGPHLHLELHKKYGAGFTPQNAIPYILLPR